jgi:aminoglycoside phosphotransferase family enzyme/predicted kinase
MLGGPMANTLLEDLSRPEAFPPPRPGQVTVASTHASWVFLTETEAWKVKRPVNLGFLDFSTADRRQRCCEDEVRLGRRLAPEVYRGVVPIYRGAAGHDFVGPGPVVDHAVRMRRLSDEDSAAALLASGRLQPDHLRHLADRLRTFYEGAALTPELGDAAILTANVEDNQRTLAPFCGRFIDESDLRSLHRWQLDELETRRAALDRRIEEGRIREGHGDLRLEHVYFLDGSPVVIDPIEFNRSFRCADAALDVAFLAMELEDAGRGDLSACFLSHFARASNDYGFYPLLDLYLSYRAQVRAKVACLVAADPGTPPDKARRKARDAARLLALARSYQQRAPRLSPVIVVGGQIGTGKSTLAEVLCRRLELPVISSDATRKHLGGIGAEQRGGPQLYSEEMTGRTYDEVLRRAALVLESGRGVLLDATFHDPQARAAARDLARRQGRAFLMIELEADDQLLRRRLRERPPGLSDAREEHLPALRSRYQPPDELPPAERLRLDASQAPDDLSGLVQAKLRDPLPTPATGRGR